ncbi:MAG: S1C family serine protease [Dehalococcoidia bacterium]|nr:S1C family serine protease [Dehalococcoidia bacterium]
MTESNNLTGLSEQLAAAVARAAQSTLMVNARRRFPASGIAWSTEGLVLTTDHVLEREEDITVGLPDGRELPANIVGRDPGSDLAVLKVDAPLTVAAQAPAESVRVGGMVLAVGRPGSEGVQASFGVVAAIGGPWRTFRGAQVEGYLRSDTTFFPGFSGGPLIDVAGRAIGINSSRPGRGAGITIPMGAAARVAGDLVKAGRVRRAYLGISSQPVQLPNALAARLNGQESGLLVMLVEPESPAGHAGLILGDLLVSLGSQPVTDTESLQAQLGPDRVGKPLAAVVLRGGEPYELTVVPGER